MIYLPFQTDKKRLWADVESLRQRIDYERKSRPIRSLGIISLGNKAGGTSLSLALARHWSTDGTSITLIDATGRSRRVCRKLKVKDQPGLAERFAGRAELAEIIHPTVHPGLKIVPSGRLRGGLLGGRQHWQEVWEAAAQTSDLVLTDAGSIDSPSARIAVCSADACVVVLRAGRSLREAIEANVDGLMKQGAKVLGIVINRRRFPVPSFIYSSM